MAEHLEDIIQQCIDGLADGASIEELLLAYPEVAPLIETALRSAHAVIALPRNVPSPNAQSAALGRMLNELSLSPATPAGRIHWLSPIVGRSRVFQAAAVAASVAFVGIAGLGAAAATGTGPAPVREFFGLATSQERVDVQGIVVSVEPSANTLQVSAGGALRTIIVQNTTELTGEGGPITLADFDAGDLVEIEGDVQADGTIVAERVRLEEEADDLTPTPESPVAPVVPPPTIDDARDPDEDLDDDNSGPGGGDDDDNSGPGSGDGPDDDDEGPDTDDEDDNSGPGGGTSGGGRDDDEENDDDSGPGSGDDDDRGSGGSGSGDDDSSSPGSGDDD